MMSGKLLLFALVLSGFTAVITGFDVDTVLAQHKQSLKAIGRNPRSAYIVKGEEECFDWYFKAIEENVKIYRNNTANCTINAENAIKSLNVEGADTRDGFVNITRNISENFENCDVYSDLLQFHYCYSKVSTDSTSIIYRLSAKSSSEYNSLSVEYNNVDTTEQQCEKNAREDYLKNSAVTDEQFDSCRLGNGVPKALTEV